MTVNLELFDQVLAHIEAHPEQWDQSVWLAENECGTVGCFAGWTVILGGGARNHVEQSAADLLGVDDVTADALFAGSQTLAGLHAWREILGQPHWSDLQ